jgi:hypothetical protein
MDFEVTRPAANEPGGNGTNDWHWITDANRKSQRIIREPFISLFCVSGKGFQSTFGLEAEQGLGCKVPVRIIVSSK